MFDPFGDYATRGYLQNLEGERDPQRIRTVDHCLFSASAGFALSYLARRKSINYADYLEVHGILFSGFYPWAGQDRSQTAPDLAVARGGVTFAHPGDCERAVTQGLMLGQQEGQMRARPGEVMQWFAYGHPFLDGNGRTMMLVHAKLARRAGFSINWHKADSHEFLAALAADIEDPQGGTLDRYLLSLGLQEPCPDPGAAVDLASRARRK